MIDEKSFLIQELSEITEDIERVKKLLERFEKIYGMSSEEFVKKFEKMELKPERDFVSWHAHYLAYHGLIKRRDEIISKLTEISE